MYVYLYKYVCKIVDVCLGKEKGGGRGLVEMKRKETGLSHE